MNGAIVGAVVGLCIGALLLLLWQMDGLVRTFYVVNAPPCSDHHDYDGCPNCSPGDVA